ncbi:fibrous sheath-interacting protein 1 isoform X2 [Hippoglossus hippoglossus]|uniref:fibrous sheath-interacting protein 1 isoform X2 n=1 Tax=Hippoglossus hippoglossus TaxID=8267 RepID=UPI00148C31CF|nr:fibrous sheath-interacting protein 1 isoform X2 [Hippoglossus hippoglossus]
METIRGSLEDISRPASSELTSSRASRRCPDVQFQMSSEETATSSSACGPDQGLCHSDITDGDPEVQRAMEEMRRLDEILSVKICREKEVKRQRKEHQAKLWQDLQNKPKSHSECAHEALNTKLFLALEEGSGKKEEEPKEDNYVPVFETQVPDSDRDRQRLEPSYKKPENFTDSSETGDEQCEDSHCGASRGKKKQRDFVKRNIELAVGDGDQMLLTQAEKQRLAELLQQIDEEEEDVARGADSEEDMWAVSDLTGQVYTPVPSDLEQLSDIDSKIRLLLPVEEFVSVQSSYTNISVAQGRGSEVGWKCDWDPQPGEKVLQDRKERRGLERQLQEIQQQLEILGHSPEMTNESADLTEEELLRLLEECELTECWSLQLETTDTT